MEGTTNYYGGINESLDAWADTAYDVLIETASRYGAYITYQALADEVQQRTGRYTKASQRNWIGKVLARLVRRCHDEGVPALTALVVHTGDGQVGSGYDEVLTVAGLSPIDDQVEREMHAAQARLDCYRHWASDVPDGAAPVLTPVMQARYDRSRRTTAPVRRGDVCPSCFVEMPVSGVCSTCG